MTPADKGDSVGRVWFGILFLAGSWLPGLGYYYGADRVGWLLAVIAGVVLLAGTIRRSPSLISSLLAIALALPAAWWMDWPHKMGPLLLIAGLVLGQLPFVPSWPRHAALGSLVAGVMLLAQGLGMWIYAHATARSHELPDMLARLAAAVARLVGIEAALSGNNNVVMGAMREHQQLAATWELFFDPLTCCWLIGALCLIGLTAWSRVTAGERSTYFWRSAGAVLLCVAAWLPVRCALLMGTHMHRLLRTEFEAPVVIMGQYWSVWILMGLLIGPALLAWRFVTIPRTDSVDPAPPVTPISRAALVPLVLTAAGCTAVTLGILWNPAGTRKAGRTLVDEYHSRWEPTDKPFDTEWYGNDSGYNYWSIYQYCSRFYDMARQTSPLDDASLNQCDVLMLKVPGGRPEDPPVTMYEASEVEAIRRFVERGGGLILIGEHTNVYKTGVRLNRVARTFGFSFRDDCLFGMDSFYEQLYRPPRPAHPIVQHFPELDFAVSCSIDPGTSKGRTAILGLGLKNLGADYHVPNYYPQFEDHPQMRYGAFVQLWTTTHGRGRVIAFGDSTQFSNFCTFDPGKAELMLGMIEWANHTAGIDPRYWLVPLGLLLLAGGLWSGRGTESAGFVLLAGGLFGWSLTAMAVQGIQRSAVPGPKAVRPMTRVALDRTICNAPLPTNGFISGKAGEFGIFERWIQRVGYFTARAAGDKAFDSNVLVFLYPNGAVPSRFREQLAQYVENGGKVLVIDSPENSKSTANSLLHPFGLAFKQSTNHTGRLDSPFGWPAINLGMALEVDLTRTAGAQPLATIEGSPVGATLARGKGSITVIGFGSTFTDANMGITGDVIPDASLRQVFDVEFALLRGIVEGWAPAQPAMNGAQDLTASSPAAEAPASTPAE